MGRYSVRPPLIGDSRGLAEAELECFPDPWPQQFFATEILADGRFHRLLVDESGRIVAYLFSAWQYLDLHILKVAAVPDRRRAGLARRLMDLAETHAEESSGESLTLEVRQDNTAAIALYESLGFIRRGIRPHYYPSGEDALVMTKQLSDFSD